MILYCSVHTADVCHGHHLVHHTDSSNFLVGMSFTNILFFFLRINCLGFVPYVMKPLILFWSSLIGRGFLQLKNGSCQAMQKAPPGFGANILVREIDILHKPDYYNLRGGKIPGELRKTMIVIEKCMWYYYCIFSYFISE